MLFFTVSSPVYVPIYSDQGRPSLSSPTFVVSHLSDGGHSDVEVSLSSPTFVVSHLSDGGHSDVDISLSSPTSVVSHLSDGGHSDVDMCVWLLSARPC